MQADRAEWWRGAVIYEIYPRSFADSNGDGIGDLPGITARLDHVADLGVDGIWVAPFFLSPMKDFGYDVADYRAVDPIFGTLHDLDALVARAHDLGLKVLIDQVWSHTSNAHPWFVESRSGRDNAKADWFVWADPRPDGAPPNNWLAVFGGGAWAWEPRRRQYYLHHFLPSQPALNWRNGAVVDALLDIGAFWLERGIDGFRLDALDFLLHDPALTDNPPRPLTGPVPVRPFGMQHHLHDMTSPDILPMLERIRGLMDRYPDRATIGELSSEPDPLVRAAQYTGNGGTRLHTAYTLRFLRRDFSAAMMRQAINEVEDRFAEDGSLCWAFSNHDMERVATRWGDGSPEFCKMAMALLLSLRGTICVYQGEELGLPEAQVPFERLQDPYGIAFHPDFKGRDGCRTPLPWTTEPPNGGFSQAEPWLPVPPEHLALAVDRQTADPDSVLAAWRRMLAWRKANPVLRHGAITLTDLGPDLIAFERRLEKRPHGGHWGGHDRLLCVFNPNARRTEFKPPKDWVWVEELGFRRPEGDALGPWGVAFFGRG